MCTNIKTSNRKKLWLKTLVDLGCTYTIYKQLVKEEQIKTKPMDRSFKIFNADKTKNEEVTRFVLLELEINGHMKKINIVVTELSGIDIFSGYDQLVKHNPEVDQDKETIWFTRCPREYRTQHQNISFTSKIRRLKPIENINKEYWEIGKKPDPTNLEYLPEYI